MGKPSEKSSPPKAPTQKDMAEKAQALKDAGAEDHSWRERQTDTAGSGPIDARNQDEPVSGALEAEGHRPVLERSRKVR